jgi:hypothetical protein
MPGYNDCVKPASKGVPPTPEGDLVSTATMRPVILIGSTNSTDVLRIQGVNDVCANFVAEHMACGDVPDRAVFNVQQRVTFYKDTAVVTTWVQL